MTAEEKELETKIKDMKKQLESPFAEVGNAVAKRGPGRPPKEELQFTDAEAAHEQRLREIKKLPDTATEEETREWFQKELYNALPNVAANLKWASKFGDSKTRSEADTKIMRALGLESKDIGNIGKGGQIVINMNGPANTLDLPWLKPAKPVMQTVEAIAADSKKKDKG